MRAQSAGSKILDASAGAWLLVAGLGQLAFAAYVAAFYGRAAMSGTYGRWNEVLVGGWVAGGSFGNLVIGVHLALAISILVGGPLQLIPWLRARAMSLHRWNGRIYLTSVLVTSIAGLVAVWTRGTAGGVNLGIGISVNGVLIIVFAVQAWRTARSARLVAHRAWALRTFIAASGVWFFRVAMMLWIALNGGPAGFGAHFDGPFPTIASFACYLVPLGMLELYLRARTRGRAARVAMAVTLFLLTAAMAAGVVLATIGLWLPRM